MTESYPPSHAPRLNVTLDGNQSLDYDPVTDVVVDTTVDGADHFSLKFTHPFDYEHAAFTDLPRDRLQPDTDVSISMGYGEAGADTELFSGTVETVHQKYPAQEPPRVVVTGFGRLREMMKGSQSESWQNESLGRIVESVCRPYLDGVRVEAAGRTLDHEIQQNKSPYAFLRGLADRFGYEFFTSLGTGYFRPTNGGTSPGAPVASFTYPESLESFSGTATVPDYGEVEVRYWDERRDRTIVESVTNDRGTGKRVVRAPVASSAEAREIAEAKLESEQRTGVAKTAGDPAVQAGTVVTFDGLGPAFDGKHYVENAIHRLGQRGYGMTVETTRLQ